jgi:hypothetical protein
MTDPGARRSRAEALHLHGLLAHWNEVAAADWLPRLLDWEEQERRRRSLERRLKERISAASSRSATSTGPGPSAATAPPSRG